MTLKRRLCTAAAATVLLITPVTAQQQQMTNSMMYVGAGWEAFAPVAYEGGDAAQPNFILGVLVLTDTTFALHACTLKNCALTSPPQPPFALLGGGKIFEIPLLSITKIRITNRVAQPSYDDVVISYIQGTTAEAPMFRVAHPHAAAVDAKIRARLSKVGVPLHDKEE